MEFAIAQLQESIAAAIPERECLIFRDRRYSWAEFDLRTRRLANLLSGAGLSIHRDRSELADWESGQDHVALLLHNGNEYLEGMIAAFKSRTVPVNVNYRFVEGELEQILRDSGSKALIYHSSFAEGVGRVAENLPELRLLLQVSDASGAAVLSGARDYEEALASSSAEPSSLEAVPDDLYLTYTGGTTGSPRAVLWRQGDIFVANMNGRTDAGRVFESIDEILERARESSIRVLPQAPFMHVAGHAAALGMWNAGGTVVIPDVVDHFDPVSILECIERERVNLTVLVGDAMARPLIDAMRARQYDLDSLQLIISGGASLSARAKADLLEMLPHVTVVEGVGSSETGAQATNVSSHAGGVSAGRFAVGAETALLNASKTGLLGADDPEPGWLARSGAIPLGYLGDPTKTRETFLRVEGTRYVVPGDRARWWGPGEMEFLGRDSTTINSGGEKVFAEEVEAVLLSHPSVRDAAVVGRPSARFGEEVVGVVALEVDAQASERDLIAWSAKALARFKLPREVLFRPRIERGPTGKIDLPWIRQQVSVEDGK